jgi:glycosyltransferase involved in cell wall biosynthesis
VSTPLRVLLVVDPPALRERGAAPIESLAVALKLRGHALSAFGMPEPWSRLPVLAPIAKPAAPTPAAIAAEAPAILVAYGALSSAARAAARAARELRAVLVLIEAGQPRGESLSAAAAFDRLASKLLGGGVRQIAGAVAALDPLGRQRAAELGFRAEGIAILPEGVDLARFRPGLTSDYLWKHRVRGRILLYTGPLEPGRDLLNVVHAFARTVGQRHDWSFVATGDGTLRGELRAQADRLGVGDRVHFLPRPGTDELPGLFSASTLVAAPALGQAALGRQVARAMACGVPVLAADVPRLAWYVKSEESGLLVEPGSREGWIAALERAAGEPVLRRRWGERARTIAEQSFGLEALGAAFDGLVAAARGKSAA